MDPSDPVPATLADLLSALERRASSAPMAPSGYPERLALGDIERIEALFQPRPLDGHHLGELKDALRLSEVLDAVTVVRVGSSAVLVDGHHRVRAYQDTGFTGAIPVRWWTGSIREAVLEASRENSKAKLVMTRQQRMDRAWRLSTALTATGKPLFTKLQLVESTGVSNGQVGRFRAVAAKLREMGRDPADISGWWEAERAASGEPDALFDEAAREAWEETQAKDIAAKFSKAFGPMLARRPEVTARALAYHLGAYAAEGAVAQASPLRSLYGSLESYLPDRGEDDEDADF